MSFCRGEKKSLPMLPGFLKLYKMSSILMFSKYCVRSRPLENGYITPTPAPAFLSCSIYGTRMVVVNGHDNYLDSLRIPCFVLPQI